MRKGLNDQLEIWGAKLQIGTFVIAIYGVLPHELSCGGTCHCVLENMMDNTDGGNGKLTNPEWPSKLRPN